MMQVMQKAVAASGLSAGQMQCALLLVLVALSLVGCMLTHRPALALGGAGMLVAYLAFGVPGLLIAAARVERMLHSRSLLVVPLLVLLAHLINRSKATERLFLSFCGLLRTVRRVDLLAWSYVVVAAFGAVAAPLVPSGTSAVPILLQSGCKPRIVHDMLQVSRWLSGILPPSVLLILVADCAGIGIGRLFRAISGPLLVLIVLFGAYAFVRCRQCGIATARRKRPVAHDLPLRGQIVSLLHRLLPAALPLLGFCMLLWTGNALLTGAVAFGVLLALLVVGWYGKLSIGMLRSAVQDTAQIIAPFFVSLFGSAAFAGVFLALGGGRIVATVLTGHMGWTVFSLVLLTGLLGVLLDWSSAAVIASAVLLPATDALGINRLWVAVAVAIVLQTAHMIAHECRVSPALEARIWPIVGGAAVLLMVMTVFPEVVAASLT